MWTFAAVVLLLVQRGPARLFVESVSSERAWALAPVAGAFLAFTWGGMLLSEAHIHPYGQLRFQMAWSADSVRRMLATFSPGQMAWLGVFPLSPPPRATSAEN